MPSHSQCLLTTLWLHHSCHTADDMRLLAGALMQIIQTQPEPKPLCTVVARLLATEVSRPHVLEQTASPEADTPAKDATSPGGRRSKKRGRADAEPGGSLSGVGSAAEDGVAMAGKGNEHNEGAADLSPEARALASLAAFAAEVLAAQAVTAPRKIGKHQGRPRKLLKKSPRAIGAVADLENQLGGDPPRCVSRPARSHDFPRSFVLNMPFVGLLTAKCPCLSNLSQQAG